MTPQMLIVVSGLPGSGKSTIADGISRALSIPVFSIDPIEAAMWRNGIAKSQTGIAAYEVAAALAAEQLRLGHSAIIDAVNPIEAPRTGWRALAAKHRAKLKIVECVCAKRSNASPAHRGRTSQHRRHGRDPVVTGAGAAGRV